MTRVAVIFPKKLFFMKYSYLPQRNVCYKVELGNYKGYLLSCRNNMSDNTEGKIQFIFLQKRNQQAGIESK